MENTEKGIIFWRITRNFFYTKYSLNNLVVRAVSKNLNSFCKYNLISFLAIKFRMKMDFDWVGMCIHISVRYTGVFLKLKFPEDIFGVSYTFSSIQIIWFILSLFFTGIKSSSVILKPTIRKIFTANNLNFDEFFKERANINHAPIIMHMHLVIHKNPVNFVWVYFLLYLNFFACN